MHGDEIEKSKILHYIFKQYRRKPEICRGSNIVIRTIILFLCGLGVFLFGMQMFRGNLEETLGNRFIKLLQKTASNKYICILMGTIITAIIQSSTAITVMVVGLVDNSIMTLQQAVWIILGANIGTTITSRITAMEGENIAPIFVVIGFFLFVVFDKFLALDSSNGFIQSLSIERKKKIKCFGGVLAGLGLIFIGMDCMKQSMLPVQNSNAFRMLFQDFKNPLYAILTGAIFTALIQSSSASIAILQSMSASGLIEIQCAAYIVFGQNIGTCITGIFAAIGGNINAKRTAIIHLFINVIGTIFFSILFFTTPIINGIIFMSPENKAMQIANIHLVFNVVSTILLLPFGEYLIKFSQLVLPTKERK